MKTIVILAHPYFGQASHINKSWIETLSKTNPEISIHNLYEKYPDWQIDVPAEQNLISGYDRIIFQYPFQWYNMPPLLKKWIDEVFLQGWAYGQGGDKLVGKEIGVAISTAGISDVYTESGFGTIEQLLKPMASTTKFVGATYIGHHAFLGAYTADTDERLANDLKAYTEFITQ
ncbi:NAD(P)H-dependent oxidoreductase [Bacteroides reticulotermitis]|uniref:Oxidoreductase n=2 Tax=Bacteroides reticulotermitis TaxID=1133319 RepID=W4UV94_9BACE|nr:NAD(P)H-dependent oxidoreductase [Bacteroides reticulotermitis]MBB4045616.1 putative NADPH-quinone reductase [Bacteroides reticulotermitis]GAE84409.1 oxidoreductase [Bacteroides reticulotermitis JCM 10512]HJD76100.1 NAD(P)H-dependent oxidoreductase [Bacteroides reticulotermitis]